MAIKLSRVFWAASIALCYPLYSAGQLFLFISKQRKIEFYDLINRYPGEWICAHLLLMLGVVLFIPAYIALCHYLKDTRAYFLAQISALFAVLSSFMLLGQFAIDLTLIEVFRLPKETAYVVLDGIQNNSTIKALFYDNSKLFFLLKYLDLALLSQILLGAALIISKKVPSWAIVLYFTALVLVQFGILIDPFYGRIIKRGSYSLIGVSLLPVARKILVIKSL